jgi:hypothetical protein
LTAVGRETDNTGALAWVDHALKHARDRRQKRLEGLLESVRAEILFEMELADVMLDARPPTNWKQDNGSKDPTTGSTDQGRICRSINRLPPRP